MTPRALRIVLIVSLTLNVFLVGGIVGAGVMWQKAAAQRAHGGLGRGRLRQAALVALTPPERRALRRALVAEARALRPEVQAARAARTAAADLLTAPALDRPALDAALARVRAADGAVRARIETRVVDFAVGLPPSQRIALGRALLRPETAPPPRRVQAP